MKKKTRRRAFPFAFYLYSIPSASTVYRETPFGAPHCHAFIQPDKAWDGCHLTLDSLSISTTLCWLSRLASVMTSNMMESMEGTLSATAWFWVRLDGAGEGHSINNSVHIVGDKCSRHKTGKRDSSKLHTADSGLFNGKRRPPLFLAPHSRNSRNFHHPDHAATTSVAALLPPTSKKTKKRKQNTQPYTT